MRYWFYITDIIHMVMIKKKIGFIFFPVISTDSIFSRYFLNIQRFLREKYFHHCTHYLFEKRIFPNFL